MINTTYNDLVRYIQINGGSSEMKMVRKNTEELKAFGKHLASLRKEAGFSQNTLAEASGISRRMIAYYESQGGCPPADVLLKLADALSISLDELLGRSNGKKQIKPHNQHLFRKLRKVEKLSPRDRGAVLRMIDGLASSTNQ